MTFRPAGAARGPRGFTGTAGVNAIPADEFIAGRVADFPTSETSQALAAFMVLPPTGSLTYDGEGNVTEDTLGATYTYNLDGTVDTITFGGVTRTLTYNLDGTIASVV